MKNYFFLLKTKFIGKEVGSDALGNRFYHHKKNSKKRWVIYKGLNDATKISPQWHGWIHGFLDTPVDIEANFYKPNLTGTLQAHNPDITTFLPKKKIHSWTPPHQ